MIGGREPRGAARRKKAESLEGNAGGLPRAETRLCGRLRDSLNGQDGFRRKAVPILLYRCFASMQTGWKVDELIPLRTYRRYGCHVGNAVRAETFIVLTNP